jgi:NAD(P)-dependent dehydrogenase (short-subunit alcohol dehydrogenase family)
VMGLTRSAALDYAKQGIRINAVNPGIIATEMMDRIINTNNSASEFDSIAPMGRMGKPEEIANTVVFLFSEAASYITGQAIVADGGFTAN